MSFKVNALVWAAVAALVVGVVGCGGDEKKVETPAGDATAAPTAEATAAPAADSAAPAATAAPAQ